MSQGSGTVILPGILSAQHQQLLPGGEDGDVSVPHQTTFSSSEKSPPVTIPSLLRLWALHALHDGGGSCYQTHHNHGPCLSQGIDSDLNQQLHLGGLGEGCVDRTTWCLSSLEWSSQLAVSYQERIWHGIHGLVRDM